MGGAPIVLRKDKVEIRNSGSHGASHEITFLHSRYLTAIPRQLFSPSFVRFHCRRVARGADAHQRAESAEADCEDHETAEK